MKKLHYSVKIKAPAEKVWKVMLDDMTYRKWTAAFNPGSYYVGDWTEGSEMRFLGPDPVTGEEGGMYSRIKENRPYEFISIEHLGIIKNGMVDQTSDEVKKWIPAFENYTFVEENGMTELSVDVDTDDEYVKMFDEMWPVALETLKKIAEK